MDAETIANSLEGKREHNQWRCLCPVHGGRSLMVKDAGNRPVVHCFGGCQFRDVAKALEDRGLWPKSDKPKGPPPKKVEWAQLTVELYEAERDKGTHLSRQDHADYRKAKAVIREASNVRAA